MRRNPYPMQHVWEALTTKERSAILTHTGKSPLAIERFLRKMVARKPLRLRGAQPDFLETDFGNYPNVRKNPFRALRVKGGNTWFAQSQAAAALSLRAAGGRGASTSHRRYVLGQARDLRRLAYHTPKAKKNPFRKLRAGADPFLLSHAAAYRTAAEAHRLRPTYRRHELLWARTLRKKAYYTPKPKRRAPRRARLTVR